MSGMLPAIDVLTSDDCDGWPTQGQAAIQSTLRAATGGVPDWVLSGADAVAQAWLRWTANPLAPKIRAVTQLARSPGASVMNLCYEWGCTTSLRRLGDSIVMVRTVDWPFKGIGRYVTTLIEPSPHGPVSFVTWPGFVGAVTVFAPGRFCAAVNKAPIPYRSGSLPLDQMIAATQSFGSGGLPLTHLVRIAALEAPNFASLVDRITSCQRVTSPGIVTLAGVTAGEAVMVERFRRRAEIRRGVDDELCAANDWLSPSSGRRWPPAGGKTPEEKQLDCQTRIAALRRAFVTDLADFSWLQAPILNRNTRAAVACCPATGKLSVQGYDWVGNGPAAVTEALSLDLS